jgi:hypothetical protein
MPRLAGRIGYCVLSPPSPFVLDEEERRECLQIFTNFVHGVVKYPIT